jgi:micrococcal nuclease
MTRGRLRAAVLVPALAALAAAPLRAQKPGPTADAGPSAPVRATAICVVRRIVDGDTIECHGAGRVRLIGMDTPEPSQRPYGPSASRALRRLLPIGDTVLLERDVELRDRYGRLLAHVWHDSVLVNWWMVREGWAVLLTIPPNVQYVDRLTDAQARAREERRGLWAVDGFRCLPADHRRGRC